MACWLAEAVECRSQHELAGPSGFVQPLAPEVALLLERAQVSRQAAQAQPPAGEFGEQLLDLDVPHLGPEPMLHLAGQATQHVEDPQIGGFDVVEAGAREMIYSFSSSSHW